MTSIVVIDPGHGGTVTTGDSSWNNATSASGVREKDIVLDLAKRLRFSLEKGSAKAYADSKGKKIKLFLTRSDDGNSGLADRAGIAAQHKADLFLSIHCNGANGTVRGTEVWVDRKYAKGIAASNEGPGDPLSGLRNSNVEADAAFACVIGKAAVAAMKPFDAAVRLRSDSYTKSTNGEAWTPPEGVKMKGLGVLRDAVLGTATNQCRACLLELDFIDNPKVDTLLCGPNSDKVRNAIAAALGRAIVDCA